MQDFLSLLPKEFTKMKKEVSVKRDVEINPVEFMEPILSRLKFSNIKEFEDFVQKIYDFGTHIYYNESQEIGTEIIKFSKFWLKWSAKSAPGYNLGRDTLRFKLLGIIGSYGVTFCWKYFEKSDSIVLMIFDFL